MPMPKLGQAHPDRLHALDNLRAVMMWLGIVLHVAVIYTVSSTILPWHDRASHGLADGLVIGIHSFRMPVFFILAGFFVALLLQKRGAQGMLRHRLRRLALPFALLWPPLYMACGVLGMLFMHQIERGTWGLDRTLLAPPPGGEKINTLHLWFLWMLIWFAVLTACLSPLVRQLTKFQRMALGKLFARAASAWWGTVLWALPLAAIGTLYKDGFLMASGSFLPPLSEWLHNGLFYGFGLALYTQRVALLAHYQRCAWAYLAFGLLAFCAAMAVYTHTNQQHVLMAYAPWWTALGYNLCSWCWSFALIGLFLRYLPAENSAMRYLSQASYWVYLIHFPLTSGFGALLYTANLPALVKMLLNIGATTAAALVSYHLLVRTTALGTLLSGQRPIIPKTPN